MGESQQLFLRRTGGLRLIIGGLTALLSVPAQASPWGRSVHELLIISRVDYFDADLGLINTADGLVSSRFERLNTDTYVEYGLTSTITIGGKAIYGTSWLTRGDDAESASGFSEIELFAQGRLFQTPHHVGALRIAGSRPARYQSGARAALQSDGYDLDIAGLYGRNIVTEPVKLFAASEASLRKRFSDAADQVNLHATLGVEPNKRLLILIEAFSTLSLRNERAGGADYDIVKIQPSLVWRVSKRLSLQTGVTQEAAGRNIAAGRAYFIGLWSSF